MMIHTNNQSQSNSQQMITPYQRLTWLRIISENVFALLLQFVGLSLDESSSPISIAIGVAVAFCFLRGLHMIPGIWLGTLIAYYFAHHGMHTSMYNATLISLEIAAIVWINFKLAVPTLIYYNWHTFKRAFASIACITLLCSFLKTYYLSSTTFINYLHLIFAYWLAIWLSEMNAIFIFASAMMTWDAYYPDFKSMVQPNYLKLISIYGLLLLIACAMAFSQIGITSIIITLLLLAMLAIISHEFGWCGGLSALTLIALVLHVETLVHPIMRYDETTLSSVLWRSLVLLIASLFSITLCIKKHIQHEHESCLIAKRHAPC